MDGKLLLVTTLADNSASKLSATPSFLVDKIYYQDKLSVLEGLSRNYDYIYFRDPFNDRKYEPKLIDNLMYAVLARYPHSYSIDRVHTLHDLLYEDKWEQYLQLKEFMPVTSLFTEYNQFVEGFHIIKKRISARARDIHFSASKRIVGEDYILQELITVAEELRVYCVGKNIIDPVCVKQPKTTMSKVRIMGTTPLKRDVAEFVSLIIKKIPPFDFYGLDIVRTSENKLVLIEVNRSPQFAKYQDLSRKDVPLMLSRHLAGLLQ